MAELPGVRGSSSHTPGCEGWLGELRSGGATPTHPPLGWEQLAGRPGDGTPSRTSLDALSDLVCMTWSRSHRHDIKHHTRKREKGNSLEIQEKEKEKKGKE